MEARAIEILKLMLGRRGLNTNTQPVSTELDKVNVYTIGDILVFFSQKDKALERDVTIFLKYAEENSYSNGVIVVALSAPSDAVSAFVKSRAKDRVQFFHIRQLQFDITRHRMCVPHRILKQEEREVVFKKYLISNPETQMPWIDSQDPMVKWIGAVPGDVVEILRHSDTAGRVAYYRYCVPNVNVA